MESKPIGVALFGIGRIGQVHLKNLLANKRLTLLYIVDQSEAVVKEELAKYGGSEATQYARLQDISKVLADKSVDAVVICTPTDTHVDLTIQSLEAGKHVLCEKPISEVTAKISQCYDVADKCGKVLMAAFNRKFDVSYRTAMQKVRDGEIGKVHMMRSTFRDTPLWLGAYTFTQTFLCHDIDILCWFADSLPESLVVMASAFDKEVADKGDVDLVVVTMTFPDGSIGILDFARSSCYGYDIRLELFGSKGMLKLDPLLQSTVHEYSAAGKMDPPVSVSFYDRFAGAYKSELDHFIDVIIGKAKLYVPRIQCERVGIVCDAIKESYETKKIVYLDAGKK